ncbi:MAG: hypothetical protein MK135_07760 [Polyangiaceae bacterium]|nr:hypothetical protein [Polyangiaceae bacterium]
MYGEKQVFDPIAPGADSKNRARRRIAQWSMILAGSSLVFGACDQTVLDGDLTPQPTRVLVRPADFLGDVVCSEQEGGLQLFQATLLDVSNGLNPPFQLPSSQVISCTQTAVFESIEPGRFYSAKIQAFDQSNLSPQYPGSEIVVNEDGMSISPRGTTMCWGQNGQVAPSFGGAGGMGGNGGAQGEDAIGVEAFLNTPVAVQGCEPLVDSGTPGPTRVAIDITEALGQFQCGGGEGEIESFRVEVDLPSSEQSNDETTGSTSMALGGAGGAGPDDDRTPCGERKIIDVELAQQQWEFDVFAYGSSASTPGWSSRCRAYSRAGVTVEASCDVLLPLP